MKTAEAPIEITSHFLRTEDGVHLRFFDTGAPNVVDSENSIPVLVLANGLGGPISAFRPHIRALGARYRILSWDYRGLYASTLPHQRTNLSVAAHARDLHEILRERSIERVTFVGWSMGVQIGLEFFRLASQKLEGLVLMNGTSGRPLRGLPLPASERLLHPLVGRARAIHPWGNKLLRGMSRTTLTATALKRVGFLSEAFDNRLFQDMIEDFKSLNLDHYFALLDQLCHHDAEDLLDRIDVPTLVLTGSRDVLTPPRRALEMARRIRGSEYHEIPRATHYAAAEFPEITAERIERFVETRVHPTTRAERDKRNALF